MNNNHLLKIIFWNACGILQKVSELQTLANKYKIDVILIGETKLSSEKPLKIKNYHTYRTDNAPQAGTPSHGKTVVLILRHVVHRHMILNTSMSSTLK